MHAKKMVSVVGLNEGVCERLNSLIFAHYEIILTVYVEITFFKVFVGNNVDSYWFLAYVVSADGMPGELDGALALGDLLSNAMPTDGKKDKNDLAVSIFQLFTFLRKIRKSL